MVASVQKDSITGLMERPMLRFTPLAPDSKTAKKALVIKSEEERLVYGEVYSPLHVDTDGEAMTAAEIKKMAHHFLSSGRVNKIDVSHNLEESGAIVIESFLARKHEPDGYFDGA